MAGIILGAFSNQKTNEVCTLWMQ